MSNCCLCISVSNSRDRINGKGRSKDGSASIESRSCCPCYSPNDLIPTSGVCEARCCKGIYFIKKYDIHL